MYITKELHVQNLVLNALLVFLHYTDTGCMRLLKIYYFSD